MYFLNLLTIFVIFIFGCGGDITQTQEQPPYTKIEKPFQKVVEKPRIVKTNNHIYFDYELNIFCEPLGTDICLPLLDVFSRKGDKINFCSVCYLIKDQLKCKHSTFIYLVIQNNYGCSKAPIYELKGNEYVEVGNKLFCYKTSNCKLEDKTKGWACDRRYPNDFVDINIFGYLP